MWILILGCKELKVRSLLKMPSPNCFQKWYLNFNWEQPIQVSDHVHVAKAW